MSDPAPARIPWLRLAVVLGLLTFSGVTLASNVIPKRDDLRDTRHMLDGQIRDNRVTQERIEELRDEAHGVERGDRVPLLVRGLTPLVVPLLQVDARVLAQAPRHAQLGQLGKRGGHAFPTADSRLRLPTNQGKRFDETASVPWSLACTPPRP